MLEVNRSLQLPEQKPTRESRQIEDYLGSAEKANPKEMLKRNNYSSLASKTLFLTGGLRA